MEFLTAVKVSLKVHVHFHCSLDNLKIYKKLNYGVKGLWMKYLYLLLQVYVFQRFHASGLLNMT